MISNELTPNFALRALVLTLALASASCASRVQKADISSSANPGEEIAKLEENMTAARGADVDVLASTDFKRVEKWHDEARDDLSSNQKQEEVIDDLRYAQAYLDKAIATADARRARAPAIFEARRAAIKAGAADVAEVKKDFAKADRDVKSDVDDLSKLSADKLGELQSRYVELERRAAVVTQLGTPRAQLEAAKENGAKRKAPQILKTAELDLKTAESVVSTNVRNPSGFEEAVTKSKSSANLLNDVMLTMQHSGSKDISEGTAMQMVMQSRKINSLNQVLSDTKASSKEDLERQERTAQAALAERQEALTGKDVALAEQGREMALQEQKLKESNQAVQMQTAIETARRQFAPSDAEAFQQGANLVVRLKSMRFVSGSADLPGRSLPILARVNEVAGDLRAIEINVQGHTDSTGDDLKNRDLSERRAQAVAEYFRENNASGLKVTAEGFGSSRPIASNKNRDGRAQNRRVDVVITPSTDASPSVPAKQAIY